MDETSLQLLKSHCCTCLSTDRKLYQLCRIESGINNLYSLLSYDSEAYREGFYMDATNLFQCWECRALNGKFCRFRSQACVAQKTLTNIVERLQTKSSISLSRLSMHMKTNYDLNYVSTLDTKHKGSASATVNFIDCGSADIKTEPLDIDDIPLSKLKTQQYSDNFASEAYLGSSSKPYSHLSRLSEVSKENSGKLKKQSSKAKKKVVGTEQSSLSIDKDKVCYTTTELSEQDMLMSREQRKMAAAFSDACYKCETCIEGFRQKIDYNKHNSTLHIEKEQHTPCDICHVFIENSALIDHRRQHYIRLNCLICDYVSYSVSDIRRHLETRHATQNAKIPKKKGVKSTPKILKPGSKPRRNQPMLDKRTPYGYLCIECNKYFDNKNKRWKHVQRFHREGFECATCGKRFAFKNNLTRHLLVHSAALPRSACAVCHKPVRVDLLTAHVRTHTHRQTHACVQCDKVFVCRASYEHHLKYTKAHSTQDVLKYKCDICGKGYRSQGELRDHVNYQHRGITLHKCPVCHKALATRRCIGRHVTRAHLASRSKRDYICQRCGRPFRDRKGLREHELIHTGERPLSCELCGATFRQSASLYTHRRRVHKISPPKKIVKLLENVP